MGRTVSPIAMHTTNTPAFPFFRTTTKKAFTRGWTVNGIHHEAQRFLEVTVDVLHKAAGAYVNCFSCGREIAEGEIAGRADNFSIHCADCIHLPEGVEVWQLTYTQRKSRRHPDGMVNEIIVHFPARIEEFQRELTAALMRPVNARKVAAAVGVRM